MAGSFGYEVEQYSLSQAIVVQLLLPSLSGTAVSTKMVSKGFFCRHQIAYANGCSLSILHKQCRAFYILI